MNRRFIPTGNRLTRKQLDCKNDRRDGVDECSKDPHKSASKYLIFQMGDIENHWCRCVGWVEDAIAKCKECTECAAGQRR